MSRAARRPVVGSLAVVLSLCLCLLSSGAGEEDTAVCFGLFTDLHAHDRDSPLEGKWMTHTEERLLAFVDVMNIQEADFVIELGDFINGWVVFGVELGSPDRISGILAWADELFARFDGPRYHVLGNHDVYNLSKDQYLGLIDAERTYYSFDVGDFHFIVLDVQFAEDGTDLAHTYTGVAGFVPPRELEWLEADLSASDVPTIVFVHQMLDRHIEEWGRPLVANQSTVQTILEGDGDVIAVFQGHDHENTHNNVGGIHYITFEALVDQGTPPSWAYVTLDPAARVINIVGEGNQADWYLEYGSP
jgi:3',5'-cyclic AMP phosphodiesterase CpdA